MGCFAEADLGPNLVTSDRSHVPSASRRHRADSGRALVASSGLTPWQAVLVGCDSYHRSGNECFVAVALRASSLKRST